MADTGSGIPAEAPELIFEKFGHVSSPAGRGMQAGVGLGLYVARLLAVEHGGDLLVESELGRGSTFTLIVSSAPQVDVNEAVA